MIILYTSYGCASCRKAKEWLKERKIDFVEKNIFNSLLKDNELKMILKRTENGTDDIISKRSKVIQENHIDIDSMSTTELISFIQQNPSVLRRPILIDDQKFLVGYDSEEIEIFIPRELRKIANCACNPSCPNYPICGEIRREEDLPVGEEVA